MSRGLAVRDQRGTMRSMTQYLLRSAMLLGLVSGVGACAVSSYGIVRVLRQYDEVFTAARMAIQDAEFTVTSQQCATGAIGTRSALVMGVDKERKCVPHSYGHHTGGSR